MTNDMKTFKDMVNAQLPKVGDGEPISEDTINDIVENLFKARSIVNIDIDEAGKEAVRKEILANNKILLGLGTALVRKQRHSKWFAQRKDSLDMKYWDRFEEYLLQDRGMPANVVSSMDKVSDEIVDLLGDPTRDNESEQRRGLIIGDVQSGKTVNYSGIICKAVDAGFRTVILLTGTTNDLRQQTQIRIDEAFVGVDSDLMNEEANKLTPIGVGKFNADPSLRPIALTTPAKDFNRATAKQLSQPLSQRLGERPMLFVIKKNTSVLKSLLSWIEKNNLVKEGEKINNSILMIDDEADYASVNTKDEGDDPSKTNELIEKLLNMFLFSSYAGFTATPYANIFIDPATEADMEHEGLFPKDYIYALDAPTNYIGARDIFPANAKYHYILRNIDDAEEHYPIKHKKDHDFNTISDSLKDAINIFLVANVIRDLRGDTTAHRSMMIHVTRFVDTQKMLHKAVQSHLSDIKTSIKVYAGLPPNKALRNEHINALFIAFKKEYGDVGVTWDQIQASLFTSIMPILPKVAHGGGDDLDYESYDGGLRTIVVGGQRLSRGLTLEGLIVSYIHRNSMAYDTLMQMGRWFGYRGNYDDLCRVYMDDTSQAWYAFISNATDELLDEVRVMKRKGATPLDFGLKVRNDSDIPLIVTARNKMRTTKSETFKVSLSGEAIETPFIHNDPVKNSHNKNEVLRLLGNNPVIKFGKQLGIRDVEKSRVVDFIESIDIPAANVRFNQEAILDFVQNYTGDELSQWDIVLMSGRSNGIYELRSDLVIKPSVRRFDMHGDSLVRMSGRNQRLGSQGNTKHGLTDDEIQQVENDVRRAERNVVNDNDYMSINRKPLLIVYFIEPSPISAEDQHKLANFDEEPLIGFCIGIPKLADTKTRYITYQINKIHQELGGIEEYEDE